MEEKIMNRYKQWLQNAKEDEDLVRELKTIERNDEEINDRFYRELEFGTAGLRGVIGAGTNRINIYIIRKFTQALGVHLKAGNSSPTVAISYDSRIKSDLFAEETASVLAGNGIRVYIYKTLMPVPCLSYAVRELKCDAGVMITASHNPSKYNGYKVYGRDGSQIREDAAESILKNSSTINPFSDINRIDFKEGLKQGLIRYIDDAIIDKYYNDVKKCAINPEVLKNESLKVVYTPLNGAGNIPVRTVLGSLGVDKIQVVKEQENPDGTFKTCPYPNPEIKEALKLGLRDSEINKPDILLATDPDCDRMGIAVPDREGGYVLLTGNETGALIFEYICKERKRKNIMPKHPVAVKTIVSSKLIDEIAKDYGVELRNVLTGFKYIGEQIGLLEKEGEENRFIFGFEESYGYLAGSMVRDKDAVMASMLICETAAFYKQNGVSLYEALMNIYDKYGAYVSSTESFEFDGESGMEKMSSIMNSLRKSPLKEIYQNKVVKYSDYKKSESTLFLSGKKEKINLPQSNVLEYDLENGSTIIIRPSGTEPKIKIYYTVKAKDLKTGLSEKDKLNDSFTKMLGITV